MYHGHPQKQTRIGHRRRLDRGEEYSEDAKKLYLDGSVALILAQQASGTYDGVVMRNPYSSWDVAAGLYLCEAAGNRIEDSDGNPINHREPTNGIVVYNERAAKHLNNS